MILLLLFSLAYGQDVNELDLILSDMNFNAQKAIARASLVTFEHAFESFDHITFQDPKDDMDGLIAMNVTGNQILKSLVEYAKYCGDFPNVLDACNAASESVSMDMATGMDILEMLSDSDIYEDMLLHLDALSVDYREVVETCAAVNSSMYEAVEIVYLTWKTAKQLDPLSYKLSLKLSAEYDASGYSGVSVDARQKNAFYLHQHIRHTSASALGYSEIIRECQLGVLNSDVINTDNIS